MESLILTHLINNEEYSRKVIPYLLPEYFHKQSDKIVFGIIESFIKKYNALPSKEACFIELGNTDGLSENDFKECQRTISGLEVKEKTELSWLINKTEEFCKEKALYNVIRRSITFLDDKAGKLGDKNQLTKMFADALAVSFDSSIGHDFFGDSGLRYDAYHNIEKRIPFDLDYFNRITKGGLLQKTLTIVMAPPGAGKTLVLCHFAAANLMLGYNVLYITMEMAQERIAERIDANLLDVPINTLEEIDKQTYFNRLERLRKKTQGGLIIKEYPTASASAANFRHLIEELKIKRNFVPDIIYVDYINICLSSRVKQGAGVNTYGYVKSIAEELRGLGVEYNVPLVTATQINRQGIKSSDPGMDNVSDSLGLPMTADLMFSLVTNEDLDRMNQIMVKQLKNRYSDPAYYRRFMVGVDKPKMRLYDVDIKAQEDIVDEDSAVMDNTPFGERIDELTKDKFTGFQ